MTALFGIILFHMIILARCHWTKGKTVPYGTVFFFTLLLVAFVLYVLITMEEPEETINRMN